MAGFLLPAFVSVAAGAALSAEIPVPTDPVAKLAFDVLDKHCARCHQDGRLTKRQTPAKNFGNVLMLEEMAKSPHLVLPGNPDGSKLFNQLTNKEMPYDLYYEADLEVPTITEADLKAIRDWVENLGKTSTAACSSRPFIDHRTIVAAIARDIETLPKHRVRGSRYLTLANLFDACADDKEMEVYRQGAVKLINSLGRSSNIVRLETIDPERTVIRINLDDLGWRESDWDMVLGAYPYGVQPDAQMFRFIQTATGTQLPYIRADWFAFTAAQPPLYTNLLRLPDTFEGLQVDQGVDIEANLRNFLAQRAGFQKSGVSQNNRLIERHQSRNGYFWTSYDFGGNRERQSLFKFPLGPSGRDGFEHDGGETLFSLPNGFQGYYLNTARGEMISKGPTQIVRDLSRKDLTVTNGISCMGCHDQGIRKARDEIRPLVLQDRGFSKSTREAVDALYPVPEQMDKILEEDTVRFRQAMTRAGLDPTLKLNGIEMINALAAKYEATVDLRLAAAEFGLKADAFREAAMAGGSKALSLVRRLDQGLVPRDQFEGDFASLVSSVTDDEAITLAGSGHAIDVARVGPGSKDVTRTFDISLTSDRNTYRQNDPAVFTVVSQESCSLTLINVDSKGVGTVLFPNKFQPDNFIRARQDFRFGDSSTPFKFRLADRGTETVIAVCNASKSSTRGLEADHKANGFTDLGNYTGRLTRQIALEAREAKAHARQIRVEEAQAAKAAPHSQGASPVDLSSVHKGLQQVKGEIVGRAAIKIEVQ